MHKKIMLTIAEQLYKKLDLKMKREGYLSIQELINAILREALLGKKAAPKKTAAIAPQDKEFIDYFSEEAD